eukprot:TRINITY_DN5707_c0_g1_i1.p1 TRINITY_DN5707_c0_g1~~TRINITY_DN5707_c0_g1_i1.p1  ORF type:complete len:431 (-),score=75.46 TRINITY_DN5707_c0_g1_i1:108-1400(-)
MDVVEEYFSSTLVCTHPLKSSSSGKNQNPSVKVNWSFNLQKFFRSVFLPEGFPESVSEDYLSYQKWDTLQAFCSTVNGILATQAVLKGVGVGDQNASAVNATIQWILRDGVGMIGRISFAWLRGSDLDNNAKTWRLVADGLNDIAMMIELISPAFPSLFLALLCTASVARAIVGVAGGATRAALTQHQARKDNLADVSAKDGSQETAVNLVGLVIGLVLTPALNGNQVLVWSLFVIFCILHIFFNYMAVKSVVMETINQERGKILISEFIAKGSVLSPPDVSVKENVLDCFPNRYSLKLGSRIADLGVSGKDLDELIRTHINQHYLLSLNGNKIKVVLHKEASPEDILKSFFHGQVIIHFLDRNTKTMKLDAISLSKKNDGAVREASQVMKLSREYVDENFSDFVLQLKSKGWVIDRVVLGVSEWRSLWG